MNVRPNWCFARAAQTRAAGVAHAMVPGGSQDQRELEMVMALTMMWDLNPVDAAALLRGGLEALDT